MLLARQEKGDNFLDVCDRRVSLVKLVPRRLKSGEALQHAHRLPAPQPGRPSSAEERHIEASGISPHLVSRSSVPAD